MAGASQLTGSCFCGLVSFKVTGKPIRSAYCHCTLCQRLSGAPFVHTVHFSASAFEWTHDGEERMDVYDVPQKPWKRRYRCKACGTGVSSYNSKNDRFSIWACVLKRDPTGKIVGADMVSPTAHVFYTTRVLDVPDALSKWDGYENESNRI